MTEFRLPELKQSDPATVSRWLKGPGDSFQANEKLLEVCSERFDWDIPASAPGILQEIVANEGVQVSAGTVLAVISGNAAPDGESASPPASRTVRVSPLAARIAADRQVDLERARGSGPAGRVNKEDVLALLEPGPQAAHEPTVPTSAQLETDETGAPQARVQATTLFVGVDMSHASIQRDARRELWLRREGFALDYLPYMVVATAAALRAVPIATGMSTADGVVGGSGLHIEVVQAAGTSLIINADAINLVGAARRLHDSRPAFDESARSAFLIEDHGAEGALLATGQLAPGAAALLSIGVVQQQAVVVGDALQTRPTAYLGLTYDPHAVDEVKAGKFMSELKRLLEAASFS